MSKKIIGITVGTTTNPKRIAERIKEEISLPNNGDTVVKSVNGLKPDKNGNVDVISDVKIAELISALQ